MKVMSRAFCKNSYGAFCANVPSQSSMYPEGEPMDLDWLSSLEIPSKVVTLWFELLDVPTKHSVPVTIEIFNDEVFIQREGHTTCLYRNEFARNGFERIKKFFGSNEELEMHVQVHYRE